MRESSKAALCGVITALSVVVMLSTYLSPFLVYTAPVFAGLLLIFVVTELGIKWGMGTYFSISLLSFFIISDKESAVFFSMFFGYFPILEYVIEKKIGNYIIKYFLKFLIFNSACILSILVCLFVLGINSGEFISDSMIYNIVFIILMNILFIIYEILIRRLQELYEKRFQRFIKKIFNIK